MTIDGTVIGCGIYVNQKYKRITSNKGFVANFAW